MNERILGIDLGTTQSAVSVMEGGFPILLADEDGELLTPSAVHFGADGSAVVGRAAFKLRGVSQVITSVKSLMGRRWNELDAQSQKTCVEKDGMAAVVSRRK